jgi:hypothetical protein
MAVIGDDSGKGSGESPFGSLGPSAVDTAIRQAITFCWMSLPPEKRTVIEVKSVVRSIMERALANLDEDNQRFPPPL